MTPRQRSDVVIEFPDFAISAGEPEDVGCSLQEQLGNNEGRRDLDEGKKLGRTVEPRAWRDASWVVCFMRKFSVPALGIRTDGCQTHCFPKAAVPGAANRA